MRRTKMQTQIILIIALLLARRCRMSEVLVSWYGSGRSADPRELP